MNINEFSFEYVLANYSKDYPLLKRLEHTKQDSLWHAEGNVAIHTELVIQAIKEAISNDPQISESDSKVLLWAAALHDYAKPITTKEREIDGLVRIVSPKHEDIGASLLFTRTKPNDLTDKEWLLVIKLIGFHQQAKLLVVRDKGASDYLKLFREVKSLDLLYHLALADLIGRDCEDKQEQIDLIELFKLEYIDLGYTGFYEDYVRMSTSSFKDQCGEKAERVALMGIRELSNGDIFMLEEALSKPYGYESIPIVNITVGISGAGKSSYVSTQNLPVVSMDQIRETLVDIHTQKVNDKVMRIAHEQLRQHLRDKNEIIWDATNYRKDFRSKVTQLAYKYGAFVRFIVFMKDEKQLQIDNASRKKEVPAIVISKQCDKFEIPTESEAHQIVWVRQGEVIM
ncbi:AAA family ATPase [Vibrio splendidus]|nr:AAA family ATPase [Vibrio splendidus]MCC4880455.1 AAA family ATPase [Vibrio splendidus]